MAIHGISPWPIRAMAIAGVSLLGRQYQFFAPGGILSGLPIHAYLHNWYLFYGVAGWAVPMGLGVPLDGPAG